MTQKKTTKPTAKKKDNRGGKRPGAGDPRLTDKALNLDPGDNTQFIRTAMALWELPKVDLYDVDEVRDRTNAYFAMMAEQDMKPTVIGYAMALGVDRRQLWAIVNDQPIGGTYNMNLPPAVLDAVKKGYRTMEFLWETYMQNRKIDTVAGIFLGKNHYGYKDQSETVVVTPQNLLGSTESQAALEQKYIDSVAVEEE